MWVYGIWGVIEQRKYIEGYNCVGSAVLGYYVGVLLGFRPGVNPGWEERDPIGMTPVETHLNVVYLMKDF